MKTHIYFFSGTERICTFHGHNEGNRDGAVEKLVWANTSRRMDTVEATENPVQRSFFQCQNPALSTALGLALSWWPSRVTQQTKQLTLWGSGLEVVVELECGHFRAILWKSRLGMTSWLSKPDIQCISNVNKKIHSARNTIPFLSLCTPASV